MEDKSNWLKLCLKFGAVFEFEAVFEFGAVFEFETVFEFGAVFAFGAVFEFGTVFTLGAVFEFGSEHLSWKSCPSLSLNQCSNPN